MSRLYLGVDGGGTKTDAVLIDQNKKVLGKGSAEGILVPVQGWQKSVNNLYLSIKKAFSGKNLQNIPACLALAGVDTPQNNRNWQQAIKKHQYLPQIIPQPWIVNDTLAALRSGTTDKNAIVIIAGTGSNCYGRNEKDQEARSGGAGHILGDEGSAFDIGSKILKSIVQSLDSRAPKTLLTKLVFEKYQTNSLESLMNLVYAKPWNKTDIAKIAPLVEEAAEKGDKIAIKIIEDAASELGIMIKAVVKKLNLQDKQYTIVESGSVFKIQKILCEKLRLDILKFSPKARFVKPQIDSATAAAYLALENS